MGSLHVALRVALVSSIAASLINAFAVEFNSADHCVGSVVGQFDGIVGQGCQTTFGSASDSNHLITSPGGSFNVIINPGSNEKKRLELPSMASRTAIH